ncbi:MAG: glycosyltransferase [Ardenticatenaceae bacterium]|nr:glycosyltransferase [Anaerolineales bacterium]MCB8920937.1 glycosyltransferase [Ardenticatenaceae bacterium]
MRILMVTPELPFPLDQGGRIRMFSILRYLSHNHEVHLITNVLDAIPEGAVEALSPYLVTIEFVERPYTLWRSAWRLLQSILVRKPYILFKYYSESLSRRIEGVIAVTQPDCVLIESQYLVECVQNIDIPVIVDFHDIASQLYDRFATSPQFGLKKVHGYVQRGFIKRLERNLPPQVSACTVISNEDKHLLQALSSADNIFVVPNGVDLDYFNSNGNYDDGAALDIIFLGSMDYYPNQDAVLFFSKEVLPLLWAEREEITFTIVGRNPMSVVLALQEDPRICVTGTVEDVRAYLRRATIVVIPLRMGAGTRIKALEAAAMGKPIVSTSIGLEGIEFHHQKHALIADSPSQLATACLYLLDNPQKQEELGANARMTVHTHYSWRKSVSQLEKTIETVVSN